MANTTNGPAVVATLGYASSEIGNLSTTTTRPFNDIRGNEDNDTLWVTHEVVMVVGPQSRSIDKVTPTVAVAGYSF